jgi:hypothetical protein
MSRLGKTRTLNTWELFRWNSKGRLELVPELLVLDIRVLYQALDRSTRGPKRPDPTALRRFPQFLYGTHLISLPISLGQAIHKERSTVRVHYLDHTPWLTFRFLYRKRGVVLVMRNAPLLNRTAP